jgi:hypothetical protein
LHLPRFDESSGLERDGLGLIQPVHGEEDIGQAVHGGGYQDWIIEEPGGTHGPVGGQEGERGVTERFQ